MVISCLPDEAPASPTVTWVSGDDVEDEEVEDET